MEIKYLGHASFLIKTKDAKVVTDPYDGIGMNFPKTEADIVTMSHSHPDHSNIKGITGEPLVIDWPGEFERKNVRVFGHQWFHDEAKGAERGENILYKFEAEGLSVLHCGDLGSIPPDSFIDEIGAVDIMMVPVGGHYTIDAETAAKLVKKIEPSIVIPMHYGHDKLSKDLSEKLAPISDFLKQMGVDNATSVEKLVIKKENITDDIKVVLLQI